MKRAGQFAYAFAAAASTVPAAAAPADIYPNKPVRLVTSAAGGSADVTARLVAQGLRARLGQQVIVDNHGSGTISGEIVARAKPDGYTLLCFGDTFWLQPLLRETDRQASAPDSAGEPG